MGRPAIDSVFQGWNDALADMQIQAMLDTSFAAYSA
jgi:hypothetical protein